VRLGRAEVASVALGVLALASLGVVFATGERPTTSELSERSRNLLAVWNEDEVEQLEFTSGSERASLTRTGEDFVLRAPKEEPADAAAVDRLLDGLGFATVLRRLDTGNRDTLGLTKPRATWSVQMGARTYRIELGAAAPSPAGAAYVALSSDGAPAAYVVVGRETAALLNTRPDDLRRRSLVTLGMRELSEIVLDRPNGALRLVRGAGLAFRVDGAERANRDALEPLLAAFGQLSATRFLDLKTAEVARGTARPLRVTLLPREGDRPRAQLEIGGPCPEHADEVIVIVRQPQTRAACVRNDVIAPFSLERSYLTDKVPFAARPDEVEALTLTRGERRLVLTRSGTQFLLREPSEASVDIEAGNQRLKAILRAPGELVPNPKLVDLGLEPPVGRVVLTVVGDDDKAAEETLELGRPAADGTLPVRRVEDGAVLALGREAARAFSVDATLLKSRKLLDFALSALIELELSAPEPQRLKRIPGSFELLQPAGFRHDGELATNAVLALGSLTALGWIADADDGSFGLATPVLSARVHIGGADAGASERRLIVGRSAPGGHFAALEGTPGVFLLERAVVERLSTLLIDRAVFMGDPKTLARVSITAGQKRFELERRAGELVPSATTPADPAVVAAALEALGSLSAEAAVHTGPARPDEGLGEPALRVKLELLPGLGAARGYHIGKGTTFRGQTVRFARADGVDATYVIAESKLRPLFDWF
jgi:hypothetical protein